MTMMRHFKLLVSAVLLVCCVLHNTDGLAVMSVDLGQEYMKVALVKPGVPMEIVLNRESQRKTAAVVSMRDGERSFGDAALNTAVKFPAKAYIYLLSVLGKKMNHPTVKRYQQLFPFYTLKEDPETGTVIFQHDEKTFYTPEELIAMILERGKESAEAFAEQTIKDVVITVPPFFNQAERRALVRAAEMVDLNVLQLMNDNSAVALNYGVFRRKEFNTTAQNMLFYDMGASSTTATIVSYQTVRMKDRGFVENNPQLTIRGIGFDATLGGMEFQFRLREHLAKLFNAQKKTKTDVTTNPRAMAKLLKEAGRVKKVLSANNEHYAQVEGLLDDRDFRAKVTREEFEELCSDLFERVAKPLEDALKSAHMTMDEINEIILMGGGTRVPKVQAKLREVTKKEELGKSINTDEAAALGAVYQAAYLSKGFKVKRFGVKEAVIFPIQVEFEREVTNEDESKSTKTIKRVIFGRMNPYPVSKVMKFNKNFDDFNFEVMYGDLDFLSEEEKIGFGNQLHSKVALSGVGDAYKKNSADSDFKGVKAHFRMDESGLLHLDLVDSVFEKQPPSPDEKEEESTLSKFEKEFIDNLKLGSTISNLFGGGEEKKEDKKDEKTEEKTEEKTDEQKEDKKTEEGEPKKETDPKTEKTESKKEEEKPTKEKEEEKDESVETENADEPVSNNAASSEADASDKKPANATPADAPVNETKSSETPKKEEKKEEPSAKNETKENATKPDAGKADANKTAEEKEKEKAKLKPIIIKEKLTATQTLMDLQEPTEKMVAASKKIVSDLRMQDQAKRDREKSINDLESYVFTMKDNLYQGDWEKCSTTDERIKLKTKLSEVSDWLDEQGMDTPKAEYDTKLAVLKEEFKDIAYRVEQTKDRPRALEALKSMLNHSRYFLKSIKNLTADEPIFTEVEVTTLSKLINDTTMWMNTMEEAQNKTACTKTPVLLTTLVDSARVLIQKKLTTMTQDLKIRLHRAQARKLDREKKIKAEKEKKKAERKLRAQKLSEKRHREEEEKMDKKMKMKESKRHSKGGKKTGKDTFSGSIFGKRFNRNKHQRSSEHFKQPEKRFSGRDSRHKRPNVEVEFEDQFEDGFRPRGKYAQKSKKQRKFSHLHIPVGVQLSDGQRAKLRKFFREYNRRMLRHRGRAARRRGKHLLSVSLNLRIFILLLAILILVRSWLASKLWP
ncbi:hypoxia up-regulated protein 1-like isoform X3 [Lineus longissimus]|uniref:hypoxia up-regulated protein 1-like isoform X3 n=1 Tax=Lineus longissimus TaxID=88925 RepID=UPI00315DC9A5